MTRYLLAAVALIFGTGFSQFANAGPTLDRIQSTGQLSIGYRESSPPFSSLDAASGKPVGYAIDLCLRIAEDIKTAINRPDLAVQFVPVTAENRFQKVAGLEAPQVDLECGNSTITIARQKLVNFSYMTFITGGALMLPAKSTIKLLTDLSGKKVSVVKGTTTEAELQAQVSAAGIKVDIVPVADHSEGVKLLEKGKVAAHAGDQLILIGLALEPANKGKFALAPELFSYEPYGIAMPRGDDDFRLMVNTTLARLYRTGQIQTYYNNWFGDWGGRPSPLLIAMFALFGVPEGIAE